MNRLLTAFRIFFRVLGSAPLADNVRGLLESPAAAASPAAPEAQPHVEKTPPPPPKPVRSEAVALLGALQREARFVDFISEPLDGYSDQQVAGAVRDVHRNCAAVIDRLFAIRPVTEAEEGSQVALEQNVEQGRFRLTGHVTGTPPAAGTLVHHGWEASKCEVPEWNGHPAAARVVAPAEVEVPAGS
ncbi:MAG: DUF2760 domain-containing protein [Planctomycetaceae bacterium]|nr:DUF2760 domain-containing protein [Planctomycetaceae bacterium]